MDTTNKRQGTFTRKSVLGLIVLIVIAAGCAVYLANKSDSPTSTGDTTTFGTATDNKPTLADQATPGLASTMPAAEYTKRITNPDVTHTLKIKDNKVVSGPTKITVKKGQSVNVDFTTPGGEIDVELDGYGIITETNSQPGASGGFHFIADKTGTFKFFIPGEEHENAEGTNEPEHDIQLGTIKVE